MQQYLFAHIPLSLELYTMLIQQTLKGVIVPVVTPFDDHGNLDVKSFKEHVKRLVKKGVHGIVVNEMIGESKVIATSELETLIITARKALGIIPLIIGTGLSNTTTIIKK